MRHVIDLHCHLLPGLDDGAQNLEEGLGIARQLESAGFKAVVATPHVIEGRDFLRREMILEATQRFQNTLEQQGIKLQLIPGAECYIFPELAKWIAEGKVMTLGDQGKYILVELPMLEVPSYVEKVLFDLQVLGLTPILAHPERNKKLAEEPERLLEWVRRGLLLQLDLRSLDGKYGEKVCQFALVLLKSGMIHFIGSDGHRVSREMALENCLDALAQTLSQECYEDVTEGLPQRVLLGNPIELLRKYELSSLSPSPKGIWKKTMHKIFPRLA